ncbi:MAG TPA: transglutaminase domain-containing protein [Pyrinomonadaceae bacterium]|nr:transglutaminase domain-containing protein [Pyrinomonadaceae bacterium]
MNKERRLRGILAALALLAVLPLAAAAAPARPAGTAPAADDVPAWLKQAAALPAPAPDKKVPAVVLWRERHVSVASDGTVTTTTTGAVRILAREGNREARGAETYLTDSGKVRELRAWLLRASGGVKKYGKNETLDEALVGNDIYNEARVAFINASQDVDGPGAVFGFQSVSEERSIFTQEWWPFQGELPTLVSRFSLTLPQGWRASGLVFNHPRFEPTASGNTYTWELRNLPHIADEPSSPSLSALAPRVAVSYYPAPGAQFKGRTFETWEDVSRLMAEIEDPQAVVDEGITAKARQLTANAKTEYEKVQAIGRFAQSVQYISIQTNTGRGGGYRPRLSTEVLAKAYGDCKDKANLMRALLKAVGIESYMVSIYSGDPNFVRAEWPSPFQFNHCIIAVKVGDETRAAAVITHPKLGRLLIFDPTDDVTPVGDLPHHQQNSLALIDGADQGALVRMPVTRPEDNLWSREVEAGLTAEGALTATLRERLAGQSAVTLRRAFKGLGRPAFGNVVERWVSGHATGARFTRIEPADAHDEGRFDLDVEFSAPAFAQTMQGRLLVFKPSVIARGTSVWLGEPTRKHPVVLEAESFRETVRVKLPAGFEVDEIPEGVELDTEFGKYRASYEVKDGHFVFTRTLVQPAATVPVEKYAEVRSFFGRVRASEQAPVVLTRK